MIRLNKIVRTTLLMLMATVLGHAQTPASKILSGTVIGTESCYDYDTGSYTTSKNTPANAFDHDQKTFVATANSSHGWVGLDLGSPHVITKVGWAPRNANVGPGRCVLGLFEGSNREDFMDAVPLYLIDEDGTIGTVKYANVNVSRGFRYVRYMGPNGSRCNISEIEFYGYEGEGDDSQFYQVTNLPTLSYHTYTGKDPTSKSTELEAEMCLVYDGGTRIQEYPILARTRGNASNGFDKKPYRIKFNDDKSHHMLKDSPLQSPAKCKKWTLINNYGDKTLMRNIVAFEISRRLGMPYTVYCQPVDVIVNGEYKGCYQLCDQISVDKNRVPVTEMTPEDITEPNLTGGYLVEVDAYAGSEKSMFTSSKGIPVTIKSPGEDEIVKEQSAYIKGAFNLMESALWSSNFKDETKGYRHYLNLESFLKHFLVGEFAGNIDTYWSVYMYKNRNEDAFTIGPSWDFDLAFNNDNRVYPVCDKSDWLYRSGASAANGMRNFVDRIIMSDPGAGDQLKQLWAGVRDAGIITDESMEAYVDSTERVLEASARLNFLRWPILGQMVHMNAFALGDYSLEVGVVRDYIHDRISWIDRKLKYGNTDPEEPEKPKEGGKYDIATAADLVEFQKAVLKGDIYAEAKLTADIDMQGQTMNPIGGQTRAFCGKFDGQGHRISNLKISSNSNYVGLFGVLGDGAAIQNFTLDSSCLIKGNAYVGVVGGTISSAIINLDCIGNEGTVVSTAQNAGGIIGCNMSSVSTFYINNCYMAGMVDGGNESAAISGWVGSGATLTNCYSIAPVRGVDGSNFFYRGSGMLDNCWDINQSNGTSPIPGDLEMVKSGELCYMLNQGDEEDPTWFQTIGVDMFPVLDSTHGVVFKDGNSYTNGVEDIHINTPEELMAFARTINKGKGRITASLEADLDMKGLSMEPIGGEGHPFRGTFDGGNHVISNLSIDSKDNFVGLFGQLGLGAEISDITLDASCSIKGGDYVGLIGGSKCSGEILLTNLANEGTVTGGRNAAGIFGCNSGSSSTLILTNCYASGSITGELESAALVGWLGDNGKLTNCYSSATVEGIEKGEGFARFADKVSFSNCYDAQNTQSGVTSIAKTKVSNGELCFLLNGSKTTDAVYFQTISADEHPVLLEHCVVYRRGSLSYFNKSSYDIEKAEDLVAFAKYVNSGLTKAKATIKADLNFEGVKYCPIGTVANLFQGEIEGSEHKISNLNLQGGEYTGLVGYAGNGATIRNLVLDGTCSVCGTSFVGGFVGGSNGDGTIVLSRLGNEGTVKASAQNAGGIIGCNMGSAAKFEITACYNVGSVKGANESAAISGWVGSSSILKDCYNIGKVEGVDGTNYLYRGPGSTAENCYDVNNGQGILTTLAEAESGRLAYLLNHSKSEEVSFYQTLGEDKYPNILHASSIVYITSQSDYTNDKDLAAGIESQMSNSEVETIYNIGGIQQQRLQNGLNIVRTKDGRAKKITIK